MSDETCGSRGPNGVALCTVQPGHDGDHFDTKLDVSWPPELCGAGNEADALHCTEAQGHRGGHRATDERGVLFTWWGRYDADKELCAAKQTAHSQASCKLETGHDGRHSDPSQGASWPQGPVSPPQPEDGPDYVIPDAVRTRVELHRAQTAYDLTLLRAQLDTITVSSTVSRRLRARREQLTAELDAWAYLARRAGATGE